MRCALVPVKWPDFDREDDQAYAETATANLRVVWGNSIKKGVRSHSPGGRGRLRGSDRPKEWPRRLSLPARRVLAASDALGSAGSCAASQVDG